MDVIQHPAIRHSGYRDLPVRLLVAVLAAHILVSFGEKESFFELLLMWDYWRSLLISFAIAFLLVSIVNKVTVRLDRKYDWREHAVARTGLQVTLALVFPAIVAFLIAYCYFAAFGLHILDTLYLKYDFPVIILMLAMLNIYYIAFYFYKKWRLAEQAATISTSDVATTKQLSETFMIRQGAQSIPLPVSTIAYFYRDGEYNFLKTFDGNTHIIAQTLDEVENSIDPMFFFRANRQVIVNFKTCKSYVSLEYGKLELQLEPSPKEAIVVSQRKAKAFKAWMGR